jgi:prevent-host-death family protein
MARGSIDIRELSEHADEIVREVQESGEEVVVTVDGRPVVALRAVQGAVPAEGEQDRKAAWQRFLEVAAKIRKETPASAESATDALLRMREERHQVVSGIERDE